MPGVKGMKVNHRAFTYKERKFNGYGKRDLINCFKHKFDAQRIQDLFLTKHKAEIRLKDARGVARYLEDKKFEESKEFITPMVETILDLADRFDITNIEAFAMTLHMYKYLPKDSTEGMGRLLKDFNKLRLTNWNKFIRIIKEVS